MNIEIKLSYPTHITTALTGSEKHEFNKAELIEMLKVRGYTNIEVKKLSDTRSNTLNRAAHLWYKQISSHCQNRGLTMDFLFQKPTEISITETMVKDFFRAVGKVKFGKESTKDLTNYEMCEVQKTCEQVFAERLDYTEEFPNKEALLLGKLKK